VAEWTYRGNDFSIMAKPMGSPVNPTPGPSMDEASSHTRGDNVMNTTKQSASGGPPAARADTVE